MLSLILIILTGTGGGSWYVYHGYLHPTRTCKKCRGLGFIPARLRASLYAQCPRCEGYGQILKYPARRVRQQRQRAGKRVPARMVNAR